MRYEDASQTGSMASDVNARDDTEHLAGNDFGPATGNLITGTGTVSGATGTDMVGAGGQITAIAGAGGSDSSFDANGNLEVAGQYGKLTIDAQGNYTYARNADSPEGVSDTFTYTLANDAGATDSAKLVIAIGNPPILQAEGTQTIQTNNGVIVLPAGVELSDVRVVGRDLVITLPDGSTMVIPDGAIFVPQLVVNGVEVPASNLAALLIGSEPQPAAGDLGGSNQSSGGNFEVPVQPLDPGIPLGDLIPPTELDYTPPEFDDPGIEPEEENEAPLIGTSSVNVSEEGVSVIAAANPDTGGSPDTTNSASNTGILPVSDPDGDSLTVTLSTAGLPTNLQSQGVTITWSVSPDGHTLTGSAGGNPVITLVINDAGAYTVTLLRPVDHPTAGGEQGTSFVVAVSVSDGEVTTLGGSITVTIEDDSPTISGQIAEPNLVVDDTTLGINDTDAFSGAGVVSFGADGPAAANPLVYALGTPGGASGIIDVATGEAVNLSLVGGVIEGRTATTNLLVFTVSVDGSGNVTLDQLRAVQHNDPADPIETGASAATLSADNLVTLSIVATDRDGDQASISVDIGQNLRFEDDGPSISTNSTSEPILVVDDTTLGSDASASFAGLFTPIFGNDGPAAGGGITYGLSIVAGPSGIIDVATGEAVNLVMNGAVVEGRTATTNQLVFTISVNGSGVVTLDQIRAVQHNDPADHDEPGASAATLTADNLVKLTATVTDKDGDTATASVDIGRNLQFKDDGPSVSVTSATEPVLVVDDTTLGTNASASFAGLFAPVFGNDGPAAGGGITYGLSIVAGPSGIIDVATGQVVNLVMNGSVVEGRTAGSNDLVFTISVDGSGVVTLDQIRAVQHNDPADHDEPGASAATLTLDNLVKLTATVTDKDGDSATAIVNIGQNMQFKDDGPSASVTTAVEPVLVVDDSTLGTNASASFAGLFSTAFGNDGAGPGGGLTYGLSITAGPSGIIDVATGEAVNLVMNGAVVEGRTATTNQLVFTISVDGSGVVTLDQIRAVQHNDPADHDEPGASAATLTLDSLVKLTVTVTDGDLDTASASVDIGQNFQFKDDGPSIIASGAEPTLVVDDTTLGTNASASFAGMFIPVYGADGPAAVNPITYALAITAGPSGIVDVATGEAVNLVLNGSVVEGRTATTNLLVFTVSVDSAGLVTLDQVRAVQHNDPADPDEPGASAATLSADNLIRLVATVTDRDGDTATATVGIGQNLQFKDDGPNAVDDTINQPSENQPVTFTVFGNDTFGADGVDTDNNPIVRVTFTQPPAGQGTITYNAATGEFTFTPAPGQAGSTSFTYTIIDGDGDPDTATVTINLAADSNPIPVAVTAAVDDDGLAGGNPASTIGDIDANATETIPPGNPSEAIFVGQINVNFGGDTGFVDFSNLHNTTQAVGTETVRYSWDGTTDVLTATVDAGARTGTVLFTVQLTPSGTYTVTLVDNVLHAAGGNETSAPPVVLNYHAEDNEGDFSNTGTLTITFNDDAPTVSVTTVTEPILVVDDTTLGTNASGAFAGLFSAVFGADGPGAGGGTAYALSIIAGPSGIIDVATGEAVNLVMNGAVVEGRSATTNQLVFTISVNGSGVVTLDQIRAVQHNDPADHDEPGASAATLTADNLVKLTVTVTDGDGDTASASVDIGQNMQFKDDGPSVSITTASEPVLVVDDSTLGTNASASFAGLFNPAFGADGAGPGGGIGYTLSIVAGPSGIIDVATGEVVNLVMNGAVVEGRSATTNQLVFTVSVDSAGVVTLDQIRAVQHNDPADHDEPGASAATLTLDNLVKLTATVTDKDGDTATATVNIGQNMQFKDDGPSVSVSSATEPVLVVDDTTLGTNASASFAGLFLPTFGADGAAAGGGITYGLAVTAGPSGIIDVATGEAVNLVMNGSVVEGRTATTNLLVFTVSVDSAGLVTLDQIRAVQHNDPADPDEPGASAATLTADNLIRLTATVTDKDGDTATATVNIGQNLQFKDDGPTTFEPQNAILTNAAGSPIFFDLDDPGQGGDDNILNNFGADGPGTVRFPSSLDNTDSGLTSGGVKIWYILDPTGTILQGKTGVDAATAEASGTTIFTITMDTANSRYSVDMDGQVDALTEIDFNDGTYDFIGGNDTWAGFVPEDQLDGDTPVNDDSQDLLLTPIGAGTAVNGNATSAGVTGNIAGQNIGSGEGMRLDFVSDLTGDPTPGDYNDAAEQNHNFDNHYLINGASLQFQQGTSTLTTSSFKAILVTDPAADPAPDPVDGTGVLVSVNKMVISYDGENQVVNFDPLDLDNTQTVVVGSPGGLADRTYTVEFVLDAGSGEWYAEVTGIYDEAVRIATFADQNYNALELLHLGPSSSDADYAISGFGAAVQSTDPVIFSLPTEIVDRDGDVLAGGDIDITLNPAPPVVLDMDGDGVEFLDRSAGVAYDYGEGAVATGWAGADDAILVRDANGDGTVTDASEFVFGGDGVTDMEALAAEYGSALDANDADFGKFMVWTDANSNGVADGGELQSLAEAGITSIGLVSDGVSYSAANGDVYVAGSGTYTRADGSTGATADAIFATGESKTTQEVERVAANSNSLTLAAALAAAGISSAAAATEPGYADAGDGAALSAISAQASAGAIGNLYANTSPAFDVAGALDDGFKASLQAMSSTSPTAIAAGQIGELTVVSPRNDGPTALLDATDLGTMLQMPTASTGMAVTQNVAAVDGAVGQMVADALEGGAAAPSIDALLAALPGAGLGENAGPESLASPVGDNVPTWDTGHAGAFTNGAAGIITSEAIGLHHDAVQPV